MNQEVWGSEWSNGPVYTRCGLLWLFVSPFPGMLNMNEEDVVVKEIFEEGGELPIDAKKG